VSKKKKKSAFFCYASFCSITRTHTQTHTHKCVIIWSRGFLCFAHTKFMCPQYVCVHLYVDDIISLLICVCEISTYIYIYIYTYIYMHTPDGHIYIDDVLISFFLHVIATTGCVCVKEMVKHTTTHTHSHTNTQGSHTHEYTHTHAQTHMYEKGW